MTIVVLNTQTTAVSEHSGNAVDLFVHNGVMHRVFSDGVKAHSGSVSGFATTGRLSPIPHQEYNVPLILATFKGEGVLTLTSNVERLGEAETELGSVSGKTMLAQYEIPLSRSKECRSYQFKVGLAAGQELREVDMAINPVRVRKV